MRHAVETCGACAIQAPLRRNQGQILAQSGDVAGARLELLKARQLDPTDEDVKYELEALSGMKGKR